MTSFFCCSFVVNNVSEGSLPYLWKVDQPGGYHARQYLLYVLSVMDDYAHKFPVQGRFNVEQCRWLNFFFSFVVLLKRDVTGTIDYYPCSNNSKLGILRVQVWKLGLRRLAAQKKKTEKKKI